MDLRGMIKHLLRSQTTTANKRKYRQTFLNQSKGLNVLLSPLLCLSIPKDHCATMLIAVPPPGASFKFNTVLLSTVRFSIVYALGLFCQCALSASR
jgi:hypothetical protein